MFGKKKNTEKKDEVVVAATHNKDIDLKIEEQLAKQKRIVVADNLMLILWVATIVLFATHLYLYGFVTFGCLAFCTFNTNTAKKLRNEYALLAVCIMSFICVPIILAIDIFKLARIKTKIKSLEKDKIVEPKQDSVDDADVVTDTVVEDKKDDKPTGDDATGVTGTGSGTGGKRVARLAPKKDAAKPPVEKKDTKEHDQEDFDLDLSEFM